MITFELAVSRTYRNKEGYQAGKGYKLNTSFQTEAHTPESFIEQVVNPGWPYTMVHLKRSPQETGAAARGVTTPKHTENFISRQELTGDDDSEAPGVVEFWLNDPFFSQHGFAFVESVNSIPGEAEKGHPTIIFDRPIIDPVIYKAAAKALAWKYPRLDSGIHNLDRIIFNAQGARVHLLGNICQWETFNREVLQPYLFHLEEEKAREEARRQQLQAGRQELPASDDRLEEYARKSIQGILDRVATARDGERHNIIRWAGVTLGGLKAAEWVKPGLLDYIQDDVLKAAQQAGGYNDAEVLRTFEWGFTTGQGKPAEKPVFYEPVHTLGTAKTIHNNVMNGFTLKPYRLSAEAMAQRDRIKAESKAQKEERAAKLAWRQQADSAVPFLADEQPDPEEVRKVRRLFTNAKKWAEYCQAHWPDLDPERQRLIKLAENKEDRPDTCGEEHWRILTDGTRQRYTWTCGICDRCRSLQVATYRRALNEIQGTITQGEIDELKEALQAEAEAQGLGGRRGEPAPPLARVHGPLSVLTLESAEERVNFIRKLRRQGIRYRCLPVERDGQGAYDFIVNSDEWGDPLGVMATDERLKRWVIGYRGRRASGDLLPSLKSLEARYREPLPWEVVLPELDDAGQPVEEDIIYLDLPSIGTRAKLPQVAIDFEVNSQDSLQAALLSIHDEQVKILTRRKVVIYGVCSYKRLYIRHKWLSAILREFNARNEAIKAKQAAG